jgi:hypothetical protein
VDLQYFSICTKAFSKNSLPYTVQSLQRAGWSDCVLWGGVPHVCPLYGNTRTWAEKAGWFQSAGITISAFYPEMAGYGLNPASADRNSKCRTKDYLLRAIDCCVAVGTRRILLYPGAALEDEDRDQALRRSEEFYQPVFEKMAAAGITPVLMCAGYSAGKEGFPIFQNSAIKFAVSSDEIMGNAGAVKGLERSVGKENLALLILFDGPGGHLVAGDGIWDVKKLAEDWRMHFEGASMMVQFDDRRYVTDARRALQIMTKRILAW